MRSRGVGVGRIIGIVGIIGVWRVKSMEYLDTCNESVALCLVRASAGRDVSGAVVKVAHLVL